MKKYILFSILCTLPFFVSAQDLQFSQYHANTMHLNPGFAGASGGGRIGAFYRNQWPTIDAQFTSYMFSFDYNFPEARSSIGLAAKVDEQGSDYLPIRSTDIQLSYAFTIPLSEDVVIQPGLQVGYVTRNLAYDMLLFPDQFNNNGPTGAPTDELIPNEQINFVDISSGAVLLAENYWFGLSAHHLNQPNQSFLQGESKLPILFSIHGGYSFVYDDYYADREISVTPTFIYRRQGAVQQASVGCYGTYEPLYIGAWYRGFPIEKYNNEIPQQDAIVLMAGFKFNGFQLGYSYDHTISGLNAFGANAHEISLVYTWGQPNVYCPSLIGGGNKNSRRRRW